MGKVNYKVHLPSSSNPKVPLCERKNAYGTLLMTHILREATCLTCVRANATLKEIAKYKQKFGEPRNKDVLYRRIKRAQDLGLI